MLENSDGTFTARSPISTLNASSLTVNDFNGDGIADLAVVYTTSSTGQA
jgi:hypothetical protein